jgi:hypothetical protein
MKTGRALVVQAGSLRPTGRRNRLPHQRRLATVVGSINRLCSA